MKQLFDINGKKMIMTGASGGLGEGLAEGLLEAGAELVLIGSSEKVVKQDEVCRQKGYKSHAVRGNLGQTDHLDGVFAEAMECLGGELDAIFNVAGIQRRHFSEEFPKSDWDAVLDINLTATFLMCQMAAREMIRSGKGGKIINFASMLSFFGGYTVPAYAASKGGVAQLTKALCNEWAKYHINVNAIAPGYMDTPMNVNLVNDETRNSEILARIPAGRWGVSEDLLGTAIYLASSASDYINGAIIPVDGGYMAR